MWKRCWSGLRRCRLLRSTVQQWRPLSSRPPVIDIQNATFYQQYPSENDTPESNRPLFPGLTISVANPYGGDPPTHIPYVLGVTSKSSVATTRFLQVLAGQHFCVPTIGRSYPHLTELSKTPQHAIEYIGFDADRGNNVSGTSLRGAYLSARYESRREETDFTLRDYLRGNTQVNALEKSTSAETESFLDQISLLVNVENLLSMPVANLSNGQTRRARIAKALMKNPEVVLLDNPYMGLDPTTRRMIGKLLSSLSRKTTLRVVIGVAHGGYLPQFLTHLVEIDANFNLVYNGTSSPNEHVKTGTGEESINISPVEPFTLSQDGFPRSSPPSPAGEAVVDMRGVKVAYGDKTVLGDWTQTVDGQDKSGLWWTLRRGQRYGIFGPNGSGKTTMLSLITSDHPQTYSLPIEILGRSRIPGPGQPGISLFDIQKRMGHSSPEVHTFFPKHLSVRRCLESAWADAPLARPHLTADADRRIDACLRWFAAELSPALVDTGKKSLLEEMGEYSSFAMSGKSKFPKARKIYDSTSYDDSDLDWVHDITFRELSFSNQRLILFLRAIVAEPDLIILDEAFSGMEAATRRKALLFLTHGEKISAVLRRKGPRESVLSHLGEVRMVGLTERQALLVISHSKEDVPGCVRDWICLRDPGEGLPPRTGVLDGPLELNPGGWDEIWGIREVDDAGGESGSKDSRVD